MVPERIETGEKIEQLDAHPEPSRHLRTESEHTFRHAQLDYRAVSGDERSFSGDHLSVQRTGSFSPIHSSCDAYATRREGQAKPGLGNGGGTDHQFASRFSRASEVEFGGGQGMVENHRGLFSGTDDRASLGKTNADTRTQRSDELVERKYLDGTGYGSGLGDGRRTDRDFGQAGSITGGFSPSSGGHTREETSVGGTGHSGTHEDEYWRNRENRPSDRSMAGGEVWAVVGPKGGVGKTTIAANLAVALNRPVGLVDLDVPFANMASLFRYKPTFTWEDWDPEDSIVRRSNRIRENVYLMSAQNEPNMKPKSPLVEKAIDGIEAMRRECGFVIVDNGSWLSDYLEEVCRLANRILLVTTPDQMSIINSLNFLKWIDNQEAQVDIVLNRSSRKLPYKVSELEEVTGCPVSMVLPETPKVTRLSWQGKLMVEVKKRHAWSKEIYQFVRDQVPNKKHVREMSPVATV